MIDRARHIPLREQAWDRDKVAGAIEDIIADALAHFDMERYWPAHPLDETSDGGLSFYFGAAGIIWALEYLSPDWRDQRAVRFSSVAGKTTGSEQGPLPRQ